MAGVHVSGQTGSDMQQLPVPLNADSEGKTGVQKSILQKVKQG